MHTTKILTSADILVMLYASSTAREQWYFIDLEEFDKICLLFNCFVHFRCTGIIFLVRRLH